MGLSVMCREREMRMPDFSHIPLTEKNSDVRREKSVNTSTSLFTTLQVH
jgi:hypothetical protein